MRLIDADALRDEVLYDNTYDSHTVNYYLDVIDDAPTIDADQAEPERPPLTLDELRRMDGDPVWVVTIDGTDESRWEIVTSVGKDGIDLICALNGVATMDYAAFGLYNDTWVSYRHKPKEDTP